MTPSPESLEKINEIMREHNSIPWSHLRNALALALDQAYTEGRHFALAAAEQEVRLALEERNNEIKHRQHVSEKLAAAEKERDELKKIVGLVDCPKHGKWDAKPAGYSLCGECADDLKAENARLLKALMQLARREYQTHGDYCDPRGCPHYALPEMIAQKALDAAEGKK